MPSKVCRVIIRVQLQVKCGLGFNSKKQSTVTLVPFNLGCTISCKTISTSVGVGQVLIFKNNHWVVFLLFSGIFFWDHTSYQYQYIKTWTSGRLSKAIG